MARSLQPLDVMQASRPIGKAPVSGTGEFRAAATDGTFHAILMQARVFSTELCLVTKSSRPHTLTDLGDPEQ